MASPLGSECDLRHEVKRLCQSSPPIVGAHIASLIDAPTGSRIVAANIERFEATGHVEDLADAERGY